MIDSVHLFTVHPLWKEDYMDMLDEMILKRIFWVQRVNNTLHTSNHHKTGRKQSYKAYFGVLFYQIVFLHF